MRLDALPAKFPTLILQRPPELWEARTDEIHLVALVQAMISATAADTLNIGNMVVDLSGDDEPGTSGMPEGEFVAVTASGRDGSEPDGTWPGNSKLLARLEPELVAAGVRYAYVRSIRGKGSITVFMDRVGGSR